MLTGQWNLVLSLKTRPFLVCWGVPTPKYVSKTDTATCLTI